MKFRQFVEMWNDISGKYSMPYAQNLDLMNKGFKELQAKAWGSDQYPTRPIYNIRDAASHLANHSINTPKDVPGLMRILGGQYNPSYIQYFQSRLYSAVNLLNQIINFITQNKDKFGDLHKTNSTRVGSTGLAILHNKQNSNEEGSDLFHLIGELEKIKANLQKQESQWEALEKEIASGAHNNHFKMGWQK